MPKPDPVKLIFTTERETKSKIRLQEMQPVEGNKAPQPQPKEKAIVEKLYVSKSLMRKWGNPETLHVTIEAP